MLPRNGFELIFLIVHIDISLTGRASPVLAIISMALGLFAVGQFAVKKKIKTYPNLTNLTKLNLI